MGFIVAFEKVADVKTLGKIYSAFRKDPKKLGLYNDVVNQAKRYKSSIDTLEAVARSVHRHGRGSLSMIEAADRNRRTAHNSFVSTLTAAARNAAHAGVDTQRMAPVIRDRSRSTDFALEVSKRFRPIK